MITEQQRILRRAAFGGSDVPILFGHGFNSKTIRDLWFDKHGQSSINEDCYDIRIGNYLEDFVIDEYCRKTGRSDLVLEGEDPTEKTWICPLNNRLIGHIDGVIWDSEKGYGCLEVKNVRMQKFLKLKRFGVNEQFLLQLQSYLLCTGYEWGSLAVFSRELGEMIIVDIEPDPEIHKIIVDKVNECWPLMEAPEPPEAPETTYPVTEEKLVMHGDTVLDNTPDFAEAVENYKEAKELSEQAQELLDGHKEQLILAMAGRQTVQGGGLRVHYKEYPGHKRLDEKLLLSYHPEIDIDKFKVSGKPYSTLRTFAVKHEREF
jgi:predicted phage-related endonuclease